MEFEYDPAKSAAMLRRVGCWYKNIKPAFAEARKIGTLPAAPGSLVARSGNRLYLHFPADLLGEDVVVEPVTALPKRATLLNTGQNLVCKNDVVPSMFLKGKMLRLCGLPVNELANTCAVVELEFADGKDIPDFGEGTSVVNINVM